jgi:hypothetical protein
MTSYEAVCEIILRLTYEVLYGYIPIDHIRGFVWLEKREHTGHSLRLKILRNIATRDPHYKWL